MDWQGIPYKFISEDTASTVNLALQSIPKIIVDTPTDYTSPFITGVVSLNAGVIPAGIAIWTFKRNATNTKMERERQEAFLTNERAKQQEFLKEERAAQIASTEKDREIQLRISKKQFDMQVLSANRQAWIGQLRELLSEYVSIAPNLLDNKLKLLNKGRYYRKTVDIYLAASKEEKLLIKESYDQASNELDEWTESVNALELKVRLLIAKIKMMLNPSEIYYNKIIFCFAEITILYNEVNEPDLDKYKENNVRLHDNVDRIISISQELFKYEWERVKRGD